MPEMPEVESLRRFLGDRTDGLSVLRADLAAISALKTFDPPLGALIDRKVVGTERIGKYIGIRTAGDGDDIYMVIHLARGGWIRWQDQMPKSVPKLGGKNPLALRIGFSDGSGFDVTEAGHEKRLAVWLVHEMQDIAPIAELGPDPLLEDDDEMLTSRLRASSTRIKNVLTDQKVISGVGNAYSDEALHVARMSPYKSASSMSSEDSASLLAAVRLVLNDAVQRSADVSVSGLKKEKKSGLRVHGKTGQPCPVCGDTVREVAFSTKSLQYCPTCQTGGKLLADRRLSRLLK